MLRYKQKQGRLVDKRIGNQHGISRKLEAHHGTVCLNKQEGIPDPPRRVNPKCCLRKPSLSPGTFLPPDIFFVVFRTVRPIDIRKTSKYSKLLKRIVRGRNALPSVTATQSGIGTMSALGTKTPQEILTKLNEAEKKKKNTSSTSARK